MTVKTWWARQEARNESPREIDRSDPRAFDLLIARTRWEIRRGEIHEACATALIVLAGMALIVPILYLAFRGL